MRNCGRTSFSTPVLGLQPRAGQVIGPDGSPTDKLTLERDAKGDAKKALEADKPRIDELFKAFAEKCDGKDGSARQVWALKPQERVRNGEEGYDGKDGKNAVLKIVIGGNTYYIKSKSGKWTKWWVQADVKHECRFICTLNSKSLRAAFGDACPGASTPNPYDRDRDGDDDIDEHDRDDSWPEDDTLKRVAFEKHEATGSGSRSAWIVPKEFDLVQQGAGPAMPDPGTPGAGPADIGSPSINPGHDPGYIPPHADYPKHENVEGRGGVIR